MSDTKQFGPIFDNPPIVEKVMGVEFEPLHQWAAPHFGLFWQEIRTNYPHFDVKPAIIPSNTLAEVGFFDAPLPIRCWFFHESQTKLLQIQSDRFIYNWQKPATYETYPHYEDIRPEFVAEWIRFCKFLELNKITAPIVKQCEITYVDHFEKGREWNTLSDLPNVLSCWAGIKSDFLPEPDLITIQTSYSLLDGKGKLIIQLQPVASSEDGKEILQLRITALIEPESSNVEDMVNCFDLGREWAVRSFINLTSAKMHDLWERKERV